MKIIGEVEKTLKALNYAILNGINKKRLPFRQPFCNPDRTRPEYSGCQARTLFLLLQFSNYSLIKHLILLSF